MPDFDDVRERNARASCIRHRSRAGAASSPSTSLPVPEDGDSDQLRESPYDPLEKRHLAESVVRALLESPCRKLPPPEPFNGAGIYVIYYSGKFDPYAPLARANTEDFCNVPIYVGRAQHAGARKGLQEDESEAQPLYGRLCEHAESIEGARNLQLEHFRCRYLVVDDLWVPLAERVLLKEYRPLWNVVIEGFGNHDPGKGRTNQKRSPWDVLHPGRRWAEKLASGKQTGKELLAVIRAHIKKKVK